MLSHVPHPTQQLSATARAGPHCQKSIEQSTKRCQRCKKIGVGSVAYRRDYSIPPTGYSFVAVSCLFSLTLYSFSVLLNVSSDKRERDFSSACKSGHQDPTEPLVITGFPTDP